MAHKRGYGFDALFCRLSFVLYVGVFFLLLIKKCISTQIETKSFFLGMSMFSIFYFFSVIWAKDIASWEDAGIRNSLFQILLTSCIIEMTSDNIHDCKAYLKLYLFSIVYMMIWLVAVTPPSVWGAERVGAAMGINSNTVGIRCAVSFILSVYFSSEKGTQKIMYLAIALLSAYISLFSGSRKAFLILVIGFIVYWCGKVSGIKRLVRVLLAIIAVAILLHLVMTNDMLYQVLGRRLERGFNSFLGDTGRIVDSSSVERKFYRKYAISMFYDHPIIGYGGNGFVGEMQRINYHHIAYSHCNYVELLSTLGIIGFVLYYRIQIGMLVNSLKQYLKGVAKEKETICVALAIILTNLFAEYFIVSYYSTSMQTLLVIIFVTLRFLSEKGGYKKC